MPVLKSDYNYEEEEEREITNIAYDCDGLPYVITEDHNLLTDHFQRKWIDQVEGHIQFLWTYIQNYVYEHELPVLENAKYIDFLRYVSTHSIKYPMEVNHD